MDAALVSALAAGGGWVFSDDVDPASVTALIKSNGLAGPACVDRKAQESAADEAFALLVAANPGATVIGEGDVGPACVDHKAQASAADEAFALLVAANPGATVIGEGDVGPACVDRKAQERGADGGVSHPMDAALVSALAAGGGWVFSDDVDPASVTALIKSNGLAGPACVDRKAQESAADEAFALLVAANPGATVIGEGDVGPACVDRKAQASAADEAFAQLVAANPGATVVVVEEGIVVSEPPNPVDCAVQFENPSCTTQNSSCTSPTVDTSCVIEHNARNADQRLAAMVSHCRVPSDLPKGYIPVSCAEAAQVSAVSDQQMSGAVVAEQEDSKLPAEIATLAML